MKDSPKFTRKKLAQAESQERVRRERCECCDSCRCLEHRECVCGCDGLAFK